MDDLEHTQLIDSAFDALAYPLYVLDANDFTIKAANPAARAHRREFPPGVTCYELTHGRDAPCHDEAHPCPLAEIKRTKKSIVVEHVHFDGWGGRRVVEVHAHPIFDPQGNVAHIVESVLDISDRSVSGQALEEVKQGQAEVSALLAASRAVLGYREFEPAARAIFEAGKRFTGATAGYVALLSADDQENEVLFLDAGGATCTVDPSLPMPIRGLRESVYRTGETVYENDFVRTEWVAFLPPGHAEIYNVLFAPLPVNGIVVGLLGLANKPDGFSESDAHIASIFGELAAIALLNSRTLESLQNSEARLRAVAQTASDAIITVDRDGIVVFWNNAATTIFGFTSTDVVGQPLDKIIPERFRAAHKTGMERLLSTGKPRILGTTVEMVGLRQDGTEFPIELSLSTWKIKENAFFTGIIRDITARRRTEEEIASLARFPSENRNPVLRVSQDGTILYANAASTPLLALWAQDVDSSVPDGLCKLVTDALYSGSSRTTEVAVDGRIFSLDLVPVREAGYVNLYGRDVTEQRYAQTNLRNSEKKYRQLIELAHEGVWVVDAEARTTFVNPRMSEMLGYTVEEMQGRDLFSFMDERGREITQRSLERRHQGIQEQHDFEFLTKDGRRIYTSLESSPIADEDGNEAGMLALVADITARRRAEDALREAHAALEGRVRERTAELERTNAALRAEIARRQEVEERLRRQSATAESLVQATLALNSSLELDQVLDRILEQTQLVIPGCAVSVMLMQEETVRVARHRGFEEIPQARRTPEIDFPLQAFSRLKAMRVSHQPVLVADIAQDPEWRYAPGYEWVRSYVAVPVHAGEEVIGFLAAFSEEPSLFDTEVMGLLHAFGARAEAAIQNAELYEAEMAARQIAETLSAASLALTRTLELDRVIDTLLDYVQPLVPYDSACVLLAQDETHLVVRVARGYEGWADPPDLLGRRVDPREMPHIQESLATQRSVLIPDTRQYPGWGHYFDHAGHAPAVNWLGVPLIAGDKAIGICALEKSAPAFFTRYHVHVAEALVGQAAVAIQNAWLFEQVRAGRERLQSLSRRLVEIQESERRYVARELHDEAAQALISLKVGLGLLEREADRAEAVVQGVSVLQQRLDLVLENLRRLAMDLRPASLDHLGLVAALRQYAQQVSDQHSLAVDFEAVGNIERLPSDVEIALYRIVQEALTNVVRHARATRVDVLLERRGDQLIVLVEDNGVGFEPTAVEQTERLGLFGMRERMEMLGGTLLLESTPGAGTTLLLEVPYGHSATDH
jgi:PAS domain S-box-containing protein